MSKRKKSSITTRALMRLYKVELEENLNGSYTKRCHPLEVRSSTKTPPVPFYKTVR